MLAINMISTLSINIHILVFISKTFSDSLGKSSFSVSGKDQWSLRAWVHPHDTAGSAYFDSTSEVTVFFIELLDEENGVAFSILW